MPRQTTLRGKRQPEITIAIIAAVSAILVSIISGACSIYAASVAAKAKDVSIENKANIQSSTLGPLTKDQGQKMCNIAKPGFFRNITLVPQSWTADTCRDLMQAAGATEFGLGCAFSNAMSFGDASNGAKPDRNCGW